MGKFYEGLYEALSLYVRYCAWLSAVPKPRIEPKTNVPAVTPKSRLEAWKAKGIELNMPPLDGGDHLIGYLFEIGPTMPGAAGSVPLSYSELHAWQEMIGIELQPWEARMIRRLSRDYIAEANRAEDPNAKPPYGELIRAPDLDAKLSEFLD